MTIYSAEAQAYSGICVTDLNDEEMTYTSQVIEPHLDATDLPTIFACLYGDEAVKAIGMEPLGLTFRSGSI